LKLDIHRINKLDKSQLLLLSYVKFRPQCVKNYWRFLRIYCVISSTLNVGAEGVSKKSVKFHQTIWRHIQTDRQTDRCPDFWCEHSTYHNFLYRSNPLFYEYQLQISVFKDRAPTSQKTLTLYIQNPSLLMVCSIIMTFYGEMHASMQLQGLGKINGVWPLKQVVSRLPVCKLIHLVVCLTTGPKPLPKRVVHTVRSRASSFGWDYPLLSISSSSSFLLLFLVFLSLLFLLLSFLQ
jgi:hypothetical protein